MENITFTSKHPVDFSEFNKLSGVTRIDDFVCEDGETLPCYDMDVFFNSCEGWNLFVKLRSTKHPTYIEAKKQWDARKEVVA